jgi:hypothetical protein
MPPNDAGPKPAISFPERRNRNQTRHVLPGASASVANAPVKLLDLSLGGLGFECSQSFRVGKKYSVVISGHDVALTLGGTVRWCRIATSKFAGAGTHSSYAVGMSFDDLPMQTVEALYAFLGVELSRIVS